MGAGISWALLAADGLNHDAHPRDQRGGVDRLLLGRFDLGVRDGKPGSPAHDDRVRAGLPAGSR